MKTRIEYKLIIRFTLVLSAISGFIYLTLIKQENNNDIKNEIDKIFVEKDKIHKIISAFNSLERIEKAYFETRKGEYADEYWKNLNILRDESELFKSVPLEGSASFPAKQKLLKNIEKLYNGFPKWTEAEKNGESAKATLALLSAKKEVIKKSIDSLLRVITKNEENRYHKAIIKLEINSSNTTKEIIRYLQICFVILGIFYIFLYREIRKKKEFRDRLINNLNLFDTMFNHAGIALFLISTKTGIIEKYSKYALTIFDEDSAEELEGKKGALFIRDILRGKSPVEMADSLDEKGMWFSEMVITTRKGRKFWGSLAFKEFIFDGIKYNILSVLDITKRKMAEEDLEKFTIETQIKNEQLEELNFQLVRLNEKLQKSETELKLINAQKDKFFSIIAHDLKGPFMGLLGLSDALANDIDSISKEEASEYSGLINSTAKKIFGLLTNLLDWSRIQTGKMEFEPENLSLLNVSSESVSLFEQNAANKKINLVNEVKETGVYADRNMLSTIIRNLVSNAVKFTNPGGTIRVSSALEDHMAVLSVQDNGRGVGEEDLNKLFDDSGIYTTIGSSGEAGTGLGLSLCRELAEINGGRIYCQSTPGQGATFSFSIPLTKT